MDNPAGKASKATRPASPRCTAKIPSPPVTLHVSRTTWPKGRAIHRIHDQIYAAEDFNPGIKGNARFSPIKNKTVTPEEPIPTLYGGQTFECAAMESVFHDVPFAPGFKSHDKGKLSGQVSSTLIPTTDLVLVDLSNVALRKLGVARTQLIDTEKACYPHTHEWAEALYAQAPDIQGLCWTSRQDDKAQAVVLFGDRIAFGILLRNSVPLSLVDDVVTYTKLLELAMLIGVDIVGPMP